MSSWSGITAPSSSPLLKDDSKDVQDGPATGDASTLGEKSDELASAAASDHPQHCAKEESSSLFFVDDLKKFIASQLNLAGRNSCCIGVYAFQKLLSL
jgi:hypothetical protein